MPVRKISNESVRVNNYKRVNEAVSSSTYTKYRNKQLKHPEAFSDFDLEQQFYFDIVAPIEDSLNICAEPSTGHGSDDIVNFAKDKEGTATVGYDDWNDAIYKMLEDNSTFSAFKAAYTKWLFSLKYYSDEDDEFEDDVPVEKTTSYTYDASTQHLYFKPDIDKIQSDTFSNLNFCNVTIPNSVTRIGSSAFSHCSSLTSVTIPDSVTSIGFEAFYGCTNLTSIVIPNSVTSIGERAFLDCNKLQQIINKSSVDLSAARKYYGISGAVKIITNESLSRSKQYVNEALNPANEEVNVVLRDVLTARSTRKLTSTVLQVLEDNNLEAFNTGTFWGLKEKTSQISLYITDFNYRQGGKTWGLYSPKFSLSGVEDFVITFDSYSSIREDKRFQQMDVLNFLKTTDSSTDYDLDPENRVPGMTRRNYNRARLNRAPEDSHSREMRLSGRYQWKDDELQAKKDRFARDRYSLDTTTHASKKPSEIFKTLKRKLADANWKLDYHTKNLGETPKQIAALQKQIAALQKQVYELENGNDTVYKYHSDSKQTAERNIEDLTAKIDAMLQQARKVAKESFGKRGYSAAVLENRRRGDTRRIK